MLCLSITYKMTPVEIDKKTEICFFKGRNIRLYIRD